MYGKYLLIALLAAHISCMKAMESPAASAASSASSAASLEPQEHIREITIQLYNHIHDKGIHLQQVKEHPHDQERCVCEAPICCSHLNKLIESALNRRADPNLAVKAPGSHIGVRHEETPLHLACRVLARYESFTINKLLMRGGNTSQLPEGSKFPLLSMLVGHAKDEKYREAATENIRLFLNHGADPDAKDALGKSPLSIAKEHQLKEIVALMEGTKKALS